MSLTWILAVLQRHQGSEGMSEPDPFEGRHDRIEALRDDLEEVLNEYRRTE